MHKIWIVILLSSSAAPCLAAAEPMTFKIPGGSAESALDQFGRQSGLQVLYTQQTVDGHNTHAVSGRYEPTVALGKLLQDSGLTFRVANEHTVTIVPVGYVDTPARVNAGAPDSDAGSRQDASKEVGKSSSPGFRLDRAPAGQAAGVVPVKQPESGADAATVLNEIVVTAQKRQERLIDVPIPVSVVDAQALVESNQTQLQEYFNQIPGLSMAQNTMGSSIVSIRGINTGLNQNPTVGFTLDDIPLGASSNKGGGGLIPEINPADLARLEVLKGPQGTLYGASSMGGLIRFVSVDPSVAEVSGNVQAGIEHVQNGVNPGYNVYGAANLPVSDTVALRASAFVRDRPGYVDDVETGQRGVNKEIVSGGRVSALWQLSPAFSLKLGALLERDNRDGAEDVYVPTVGFPFTSDLRGLQQFTLPGSGRYDREVQVYSLALKGQLGSVQIAAISGYNINSASASADFSYAYGTPVDGVTFPNSGRTDKFTQEIRLTGSIGSHLDALLGGFFTRELSSFNQSLLSINRQSNRVDGTLFYSNAPVNYKETAGFADLTFKPTDRFDIQVGGRLSHLTSTTLPNLQSGSLLGGSSVTPESTVTANVFTYLVSPEYRITPDMMVYGRAGSGYRPGGGSGNPSPETLCVQKGFPCSFRPDRTTDYDLGIKGTFLQRTLSVDASIYYIDWKNLQLNLITPDGWSYTGNGSRAKSEGVEVSVEAHPVSGLTLSGWISYDDAELTRTLPHGQNVGVAGDRLPYTSRFSGNLAAKEEFPIFQEIRGELSVKVTYVGSRIGEFNGALPEQRQDLPAYTQTDIQAGVIYRLWQGSLYVNNLSDVRGTLLGGFGSAYPFAFDYIQPRTAGLTLSRKF